jgi:hypothetical protein
MTGVAYQVDTWQGPWQMATPSKNTFSATTAALQAGVHILYAYATDAQAATSTNTFQQSSPLTPLCCASHAASSAIRRGPASA